MAVWCSKRLLRHDRWSKCINLRASHMSLILYNAERRQMMRCNSKIFSLTEYLCSSVTAAHRNGSPIAQIE